MAEHDDALNGQLEQDIRAASPPPTSLSDLEARVLTQHSEVPQRKALAQLALSLTKEGLAKLAALGHNFHLVEGASAPTLRFPQMIYKDQTPPRTVESEDELQAALVEGWREKP